MRALLSVYDKTGLVELGQALTELGIEIIASGGTSHALDEAGIAHSSVEQVTLAPEMLGGRVKTLHPNIHGAILADRSNPEHMQDLENRNIDPIDLVFCNLYPFGDNPSIEMIDVGGPTMVRAAAKNHSSVGVIVSPKDYDSIIQELKSSGSLSDSKRLELARKAFAHTASYDAQIVQWFDSKLQKDNELPPSLHLSLEKVQDLRYGENPHQIGARYRKDTSKGFWDSAVQHWGIELSYLNLFDGEAAWRLVHELGDSPTAAVIKHANPSGVAIDNDISVAYQKAFDADPISAFGGIVALNRPVDEQLAQKIVANPKADVLMAPSFSQTALEILEAKRKNMRILSLEPPGVEGLDLRKVDGGYLVQYSDTFISRRPNWKVAGNFEPSEQQWLDLEMAWIVCGYVKSNAIILVKDGNSVGIGAGQPSRLDSAKIAVEKAGEKSKGSVAASDAFFPFRDGLDSLANSGVKAVIQPGGSMRDKEVIAAADEHEIAMVLTSERHFRH